MELALPCWRLLISCEVETKVCLSVASALWTEIWASAQRPQNRSQFNVRRGKKTPNNVVAIARRLNSLLSVETGYIITEGFSHHIAPPERLLCPQSLCEGSYQAINHRQSSAVAATWLLMRAFSFHQSRAGSVQGSLCLSFHASPLLSDASPTFSSLYFSFAIT